MKLVSFVRIGALMLLGTWALPADADEIVIDVSMPEIIFSGVANPFPAAYYFAPDRRLLASGVGKDAKFFRDQVATLSGASVGTVDTKESHRTYLFQHLDRLDRKANSSARYRVFFLTIHPSMGRSAICEKLLAELRHAVAQSASAKYIDLVILQAAG